MSDILGSLIVLIRGFVAQRYVVGAGFVILIYDILITPDDEINLIWSAPLSLAKVLFLINRYYVPAALISLQYMLVGFATPKSDHVCARYLLAVEIVQVLEEAGIIPLMLLLRLYALYNRSRLVLNSLLVLAGVVLTTVLTLIVVAIEKSYSELIFVPILNTCGASLRPPYFWVVWMLLMIYESLIFTLIIYKTWDHVRGQLRVPVLTILLRDGLVYFAIMSILGIFSMVTFLTLPESLYTMGFYLTWPLQATVVSRIYLNLRNVSNHGDWTKETAWTIPGPPPAASFRGREHVHARAGEVSYDDEEEAYELQASGPSNPGPNSK